MINSYLDEFRRWLKERGLRGPTINTYMWAVRAFSKWAASHQEKPFSIKDVSASLIEEYRAYLKEQFPRENKSVRRRLSGARSFARWSFESGHVLEDPLHEQFVEGVEEFRTWMSGRDIKRSTVRVYLSRLNAYGKWFKEKYGRLASPAAITLQNFQNYATEKEVSTPTLNGRKSALRWYLRWAAEKGYSIGPSLILNADEFEPEFVDWLMDNGTTRGGALRMQMYVYRFLTWHVEEHGRVFDAVEASPDQIGKYFECLVQGRGMKTASLSVHRRAIEKYLEWSGTPILLRDPEPILHMSSNVRNRLQRQIVKKNKRRARSARALLELADGRSVVEVSDKESVSRWTVYLWAQKLAEELPEDVEYTPQRKL
ncbi:MAG: phage integrase N-terminal SAM-like domain-containing protein [Chloroflexota bacterium]|nr:phage integrase N-terminal SAM-like domain-containing protein [Chloroflexota bacterium]